MMNDTELSETVVYLEMLREAADSLRYRLHTLKSASDSDLPELLKAAQEAKIIYTSLHDCVSYKITEKLGDL